MSRITGLRASVYGFGFVVWLAMAIALPLMRIWAIVTWSWVVCAAPGVLLFAASGAALVGWLYLALPRAPLEAELFPPERVHRSEINMIAPGGRD